MQAFEIEAASPGLQKPLADQAGEYHEYRYRWVIVVLFGLCTMSNAIASNACFPIATKLANTYEVSNAAVNSVALIFLLVYTLMNFPANYIVDLRGLRIGLIIGSTLICLGLGVTLFINGSFWWLLVGNFIMSAGQPFVINCPAKIATFWFHKENRPFATSLLTAINLVGIALGFLLPTVIVEEDSTGAKAKRQVFVLFLVEFIFSATASIMVWLFMKAMPPTPASKGSEAAKTPFKEAIKAVFHDHSFRLLFIGFVFFYGSLLTFSSIGNFLFKPYGYTDFQISLNGIGLLVCGVIGSIVVSLYVKRTHKYMKAFKICTLSAVLITIIVNIMLNTVPTVLFSILCMSTMGFLVTPILPLTYDLGCELVFPVGEALVTGILNGGGMIFSAVMILLLQLIIGMGDKGQSLKIMIVMTSVTIIGLVFYWRIKPKLRRREHEAGTVEGKEVNDIEVQPNPNPNNESLQQGEFSPDRPTEPEPEPSEREKRYVQFRDQQL